MDSYTIISWIVVLAGTGVAYWYYIVLPNQRAISERNTKAQPIAEQAQTAANRRRGEKQPKKAAEKATPQPNGQNSSEPPTYADAVATGATPQKSGKKRKAGKTQQSDSVLQSAPVSVPATSTEEVDANKDWASRLQAAKEGVSFSASSKNQFESAKSKSKKNKRQPNGVAGDKQTAEEFYAGTDAEITPSQTPKLEALPAASNVSDMLEAPQAGPSSLRITGEEKPKKVHTPKQPEAQETKKQRQNRRKVEEQKALREQAEQERQVLLEKQRRSAREARGERAKNGLSAPPPPTSNAWSQPARQVQSAAVGEGPLFDTFEQDGLSTASSNEMQTSSTTPATNSSIYGHDLPSEEAQMQMLDDLTSNSGWNEVAKPRKNKKKDLNSPPMEASGKENGSVPTPSSNQLSNGNAKPPKFSNNTNTNVAKKASAMNGFALLDDTSASGRIQSHPDDSEWTVA